MEGTRLGGFYTPVLIIKIGCFFTNAGTKVMDVARKIMELHFEASRRGMLSMWTIYDHPSDYPDVFIARRFEYDQPTSDLVITKDLASIRHAFRRAGLTCFMRADEDDPCIMETWL
jgi:hypothetical protein